MLLNNDINFSQEPVRKAAPPAGERAFCNGIISLVEGKEILRKIYLIIFIFCIFSNTLFSGKENIKFRRITVEQGLAGNSVYKIIQDSIGYMWFETNNGLNRYDGYNMNIYQHDPHKPGRLRSTNFDLMCADKTGGLWIGTYNGLSRYDPVEDRFFRYKSEPNNPNSLSHNDVISLCAGKAGYIWIGTDGGGLNKFDPVREKFTCYKKEPDNPNSLSHNTVTAIYQDKSGILWIGTIGEVVNKFDPEKEKFTRYRKDPRNPQTNLKSFVASIRQSELGEIWVRFGNHLVDKFNPETGTFKHFKHNLKFRITAFHEDRTGILWFGTRFGLVRYDIEAGTYIQYKHNPDDPESLSENFITSIYEDRSGLLWFGTLRTGINIYDRGIVKFDFYPGSPEVPGSINYGSAFSLCEDLSGTTWVGTGGKGLHKLDFRGKQLTAYLHDPLNPNTVSSNFITALCLSRTGAIWIGCSGGGLDKFNPGTGEFTHYKVKPGKSNSLVHNVIFRIYEDREGCLWIGTPAGLNKFDPVKEHFTPYLSRFNKPGKSYDIRAICEDKSGIFWVGTYLNGIFKFEKEKEKFINFKHEPGNPQSISSNWIFSIYEDQSGTLWIGTGNGGLNKFDRDKETFSCYTIAEGLPDNIILGILEDDEGSLWLSTRNGLSKFNPKAGTFKNYTPKNGLQGYSFNAGAYYKSREGRMFFAGENGINAFFPGEIKDNPFIPPVVITAFTVFGRNDSPGGNILKNREIKLSYRDSFSAEFAALCYSWPGKNQYAYMLEDLDKDWKNLKYKREVVFANLPAGNYTLKVKGANEDGVWNEEGTALKIIILPPFWQTWWFRIPVIILIIVIAINWYKKRIERLTKKIKTEAALEHFFLKYNISEREKEIIYLILAGKSNKDIEDRLYISIGTVKNHVYNIYKKLHVKNRAQLLNLFKNLHQN